MISSFDHDDLVAANHGGRRYALGILLATPLHRLPEYVRDIVGADTVHVSTEVIGSDTIGYRRGCSPAALRHEVVDTLKEQGIPVLVYTVNHQAGGNLARHLAEIGVAGLFTDDPSGMRRGFLGPSAASR